MSRSQQTHATLPHLPKGMALPNVQVDQHSRDLIMPGQKALPAADWRNEDQRQLVPLSQSNRSDYNNGRMMTSKHGLPWTDRQDNFNLEPGQEPPPMFSAQPKKLSTLRRPGNAKTKQIYRMDNCLDPVDVLSTRLESWRVAIKNLVHLFKKFAACEAQSAKGYVNASKVVTVPFENANGQFLEPGRGGIQDVWASLRDYTMQNGILRHESSGYIEKSVIPSLRAIKEDIKRMIASINKDKGLRNSQIFDSRMHVDRQITRLDKGIQHFQRAPLQANESDDPFMLNLGIIHGIRDLCDRENELHDNIIGLQKETGIFEQKIIENVRHILQNFQDWRIKNKLEVPDYLNRVMDHFNNVKPGMEWNEFVLRNQYNLLSENSAYKTESMVDYPNKNSKYCRAVKVGPLQHRAGAVKGWVEGVYILTPAGFMHGYKTPQHFQNNPASPNFSIFVPHCNLERNDSDGSIELRGKDKRSAMGLGTHHVFRARNRRETEEWFDALAHTSDQFRAVPLLEGHDHRQFSRAPVHRDLPPLPPSALPKREIEGNRQPAGAIEGGPSSFDQQQQQQHSVNQMGQDNSGSYGQQATPGAIGAAAVQRGDIGHVLDDQDPVLEGEEGMNVPTTTTSRGINSSSQAQQSRGELGSSSTSTNVPHPATALSGSAKSPTAASSGGGRPDGNTTYGETGVPFAAAATVAGAAAGAAIASGTHEPNAPQPPAHQQSSTLDREAPSSSMGGLTGTQQGSDYQQQQERAMGESSQKGQQERLDNATNSQAFGAYGPSGLQAQSQRLNDNTTTADRGMGNDSVGTHGVSETGTRGGGNVNEQVFAAYGPTGLEGGSRLTDHDGSITGTSRTKEGIHSDAYGANGLQAQSTSLADQSGSGTRGLGSDNQMNSSSAQTGVSDAYDASGLQAQSKPLNIDEYDYSSPGVTTSNRHQEREGLTGTSEELNNKSTNAGIFAAYGATGLQAQSKPLNEGYNNTTAATGDTASRSGMADAQTSGISKSNTDINDVSTAYGATGLQAEAKPLNGDHHTTTAGTTADSSLAKEGTGAYEGAAPVNTTNEQIFSAYGASGLESQSQDTKQPSKQQDGTNTTGYIANVSDPETTTSKSFAGKIKSIFGYGNKEETHPSTNFADEYNSANHLGAQDGVHHQRSTTGTTDAGATVDQQKSPHQQQGGGVGAIMDDGYGTSRANNDLDEDEFYHSTNEDGLPAVPGERAVPVKPSTRFTTNADIEVADDIARTGTPPIAVQ